MPEPPLRDDPGLVAELRKANAGLREVINAQVVQIETLSGQVAALSAQVAAQVERIAELERRLGADSSTSSRPPSSDPPYRKPEPRSGRRSSGRKPGKQPGGPGATMPLVDDPDEIIICDLRCCGGCGADLSEAPVTWVERRQVTDVRPPPPPHIIEYQIRTRICPGCAAPPPRTHRRACPRGRPMGPGSWPGQPSCCARTTYRSGGRGR